MSPATSPSTLFSAGAVLACLAVALVAPPVAAESYDPDWALGHRDITVTTTFTGFVITSARDDDNATDRLTYRFDTATATLTTEFEAARPDNLSGLTNRIRLNALLEYEDLDGDGRLGLTDHIVQQMAFTDMLHPVVRYTGPAGDAHEVYVRFTLPHLTRGTVELFVTAMATPGGDGTMGIPLDVGLTIDRFPFVRHNNTSLALDVRVDPAPGLTDEGVINALGPYRLGFAWNDTVVAAGEAAPVAVTLQRYSGAQSASALVALSYPAERHLDHSWSILTGYVPPPDGPGLGPGLVADKIIGEWRIFSVGLLLAVVAIGGATYPRLRRRW